MSTHLCLERRFSIEETVACIDYAYQPIISTSTLKVHGFEALARLTTPVFGDIQALLDASHVGGIIRQVERELLRKAVGKFADYPDVGSCRLFCNLDNRVFDGSVPDQLLADELFGSVGIPLDHLCLELSERDPIVSQKHMAGLAQLLGRRGARIALDDFGVGVSSLQLLMTIEPQYIKIDKCFVEAVSASSRKQAIVAKLCELSHALGFLTVAEGVEAESDFRMVRDLGCDFAQGFHIARPTERLADLATAYGRALTSRSKPHMSPRVADLLSGVEALLREDPLSLAANVFKQHPNLALIPVVDQEGIVQGAILEEDMRRYLLSDFGPSLLANKSAAPPLSELIKRCPVADAYGSTEAIVNSYLAAETSHGIILINEGRYHGYLTNNALLRLAAEREVTAAREQNPLTQLPGNQAINRRISETLCQSGSTTLVLFDFDHFKSFNDVYGFAAGDNALLLFAQLLRGIEHSHNAFAGHIGGDDFFLAIQGEHEANQGIVIHLCEQFRCEVAGLYSEHDRDIGGISTIDRYGEERFFPLLRSSAALLHLPTARAHLSQGMVESQLAAAKDGAKRAVNGIFISRLPENGVDASFERIAGAFCQALS